MPILFHYTCRDNIDGIFHDGVIRPSPSVIKPGGSVIRAGEIYLEYAVCLTSDIESVGHGLPNGREVSQAQAKGLDAYNVVDDKFYSIDHTKYRIRIGIPEGDEKLLHVPSVLSKWPIVIEGLEIAGYFPCLANQLSSQQIDQFRYLLSTGRITGKSKTWWYYCGSIPVEWIIQIDSRSQEGVYMPSTPESFRQRLLGKDHGKYGY